MIEKIVLSLSAVLGLNHESLVQEKLQPLQRILGLTDEGMKEMVVNDTRGLSVGHLEEKWALMMSRFEEEEGDAQVSALRWPTGRGLGVSLKRLHDRLDDLDGLGDALKEPVWFYRLVMRTDERWAAVLKKRG